MSDQTSEKIVLSRTTEILRNARNALQQLENWVTGSTSGEHEQILQFPAVDRASENFR